MKILLLILINHFRGCFTIQPYFPPQIVFSPNDGQQIYAIDEINQRAFTTDTFGGGGRETAYVLQHFPYAIPNSPQSKYYVQLVMSPSDGCLFVTYWKIVTFSPVHRNDLLLYFRFHAQLILVAVFYKFQNHNFQV